MTLNPSTVNVEESCPLQHVKTLIGLSRRRLRTTDVLTLIETRQIKWAWDIARKDASRPELRLWRESLVKYLNLESGVASVAVPVRETTIDRVVTAVLPSVSATIREAATIPIRELRRRFLCCSNHIWGLIEDGELECSRPPSERIRAAISYRSAYEFLKRRSVAV